MSGYLNIRAWGRRREWHPLGRLGWLLIATVGVAVFTFAEDALLAVDNDNFESAIAVAALPFTDTKNVQDATRQANEPTATTEQCTDTIRARVAKTIWYTYTPAEAERLVASTYGSANTVLAVFRAGDPDTMGNLQLQSCNDNAERDTAGVRVPKSVHSEVVFDAVKGRKYYFQVGWILGSTNVTFRLGVFRNAALLVQGTDSEGFGLSDRAHLEDALRKSPVWSHASIRHIGFPTDAELAAAITETFRNVPANGIALFYYTGHATKRPFPVREASPGDDPPPDEPATDSAESCTKATHACDELIAAGSQAVGKINDDRLGEMFQNQTGRAVLVFDNCYAAGLTDGGADFRGDRRSVPGTFLLASGANQISNAGTFPWNADNHTHSFFTGGLILGLSAAGGFAAADGVDGTVANGQITVAEWFRYADEEVGRMVAEATAAGRRVQPQDPEPDDSRPPAGSRAADIVIFTYDVNQPDLLPHHRTPLPPRPARRKCGASGADFGDAPDPVGSVSGRYPTNPDSGGAQHTNAIEGACAECGDDQSFLFEWLGPHADSEPLPDPEQPDNDLDDDGDPGDAGDDGVEFERVSASSIRLRVTVSVFDRNVLDDFGQPRYDSGDPSRRLYLNGWADWNGDGAWSATEKIVGMGAGAVAIDPRQDPQFADDGRATYTFLVPVPVATVTDNFYYRFRLDYGEDVGEIDRADQTLQEEKGKARAGEVEDYCDVLGIVPRFAGTSPPVTGSVGHLILNSDLLRNKRFEWNSTDPILGQIALTVPQASIWQYRPPSDIDPARLVFIGGANGVTLQGNVLLEPYNRAVVDVISAGRRVRYLLNLDSCRSVEP